MGLTPKTFARIIRFQSLLQLAGEDALRRAGVPYLIVGGVRFYERREIRDVVAYLRLVSNPLDDVAFRRAVAAPARGIGKATLDRLADGARAAGVPLLALCAAIPGDITGKPRRALEEFAGVIARLGERRGGLTVPALIDEVPALVGQRDEHVLADWTECTSLARDLSQLAAA